MSITDTARIDFLQKLLDEKKYTGKAILRWSTSGRGWRLHETNIAGATENIRDAIDDFIWYCQTLQGDTK